MEQQRMRLDCAMERAKYFGRAPSPHGPASTSILRFPASE
jgi:hypothetical protein